MPQFRLYDPVKAARINQEFGENPDDYAKWGEKGHPGRDYGVPSVTPVYPAHKGRVTKAEFDNDDGYFIVVRSQETYDYKGQQVYFETLYCHLTPGSFRVSFGDLVDPANGTPMALSNNTGASTGPHLHFGLKPVALDGTYVELGNGYNSAIDCRPYLTGIASEDVPHEISLLQKLVALLQAIVALLKKRSA
jgi:murein DD-endopeptidase MepM/ murein hydrolase activator NlpD